MKTRYLLIPYTIFLIVVSALIVSFPKVFRPDLWERIMDILMAGTAVIGLFFVLKKTKSKFRGWIPLIIWTGFFLFLHIYMEYPQQRVCRAESYLPVCIALYHSICDPFGNAFFEKRSMYPDRRDLPLDLRMLRI